jgi:predicted aldo/keto reductase-like oxidoreductase
VRYALDAGVTHFDTAESYGGGASERTLGKALAGCRDRCTITSKTVASSTGTRADFMRGLEESLRRLGTDRIDVYLNPAVNDPARIANPEWQAFVADAKRQGKIRFSGMSGHAGRLIECLDYALDHDQADVVLVAYNFGQDPKFYERFLKDMDMVSIQPDLPRVLKKARAKNVGVQTMKTLMGARLNDMRPTRPATRRSPRPRSAGSCRTATSTAVDHARPRPRRRVPGRVRRERDRSRRRRPAVRYASLQAGGYCRHGCGVCESSCPAHVPIGEVLGRMYARDTASSRSRATSTRRRRRARVSRATAALCGRPARAAPNLLARATHALLI